MTLSAALDSGLAFAVVVIFFAFIYSGWMSGFTWWGTEIYKGVSYSVVLNKAMILDPEHR